MKKIGILTLGCSKNLVDSEETLALLEDAGYAITADIQEAEAIVVNTCAFIEEAREESVEEILRLTGYKKEGNCRHLVVMGCLSELYKQELLREIPEIDAIAGAGKPEEVVSVLQGLSSSPPIAHTKGPGSESPIRRRVLTGAPHSAYLKIADGCNHNCSYCIIPRLRGKLRSKPVETVLAEARSLVQQGAKELNLIAQDTTSYGLDLYREPSLPALLQKLVKIEGVEWIRLLYAYPSYITGELITLIGTEDKICNYLDMPLQHVNDQILKAMHRRERKKDITATIDNLRRSIPGITLRTTFMVGHPGETEGQFQELLTFMKEYRLDRVGIFPYSREEGTKAANMPQQVPEHERQRRYQESMLVQQKISRELNENYIGKQVHVIIDRVDHQHKYAVGRTEHHAPEVDGEVYIQNTRSVQPGEIRRVIITGASEYDLFGELQR